MLHRGQESQEVTFFLQRYIEPVQGALRAATADLQIIDIYDPTPRHAVGLPYLKNEHQNLAAKEFATLCQTTMKDLKADRARQAKAVLRLQFCSTPPDILPVGNGRP